MPFSRYAAVIVLVALAPSACDSDGTSANQAPEAAFTFTDGPLEAESEITFTANASDADGPVAAYRWDFDGDGEDDDMGAEATYEYAAAGDYDVTLTVADDDGSTTTATEVVNVFAATAVGRAASAEAWSWVDVDGAQCRDSSATGFGVRTRPGSENLFVYLQGGGACFSEGTCADNPASFDEADFDSLVTARGTAGLFDTSRTANPVRDWNAVFVPYCTGDVHAGSAPNGETFLDDIGPQQFVGHRNVELYLDALSAYFRDALTGTVLLTGASAGGFGTLANFDDFHARLAGNAARAVLLDDSGPIFYDDDVLSPSLQAGFVDQFNLSETFPADAGALLEADGLPAIHGYYAEKYPDAVFGLTSHLRDAVIRAFFAVDGPISEDAYAAGLRDLNEQAPPAWRTLYAPGDAHTFLGSERFYQTRVEGVRLTDWFADLLVGEAPDVAPPPTASGARR